MKKEEIREYITRHPTRFTNLDYMNLFKITTEDRERDDAAIDWIEDILQAAKAERAAKAKSAAKLKGAAKSKSRM